MSYTCHLTLFIELSLFKNGITIAFFRQMLSANVVLVVLTLPQTLFKRRQLYIYIFSIQTLPEANEHPPRVSATDAVPHAVVLLHGCHDVHQVGHVCTQQRLVSCPISYYLCSANLSCLSLFRPALC